jgi:hypothetical protein
VAFTVFRALREAGGAAALAAVVLAAVVLAAVVLAAVVLAAVVLAAVVLAAVVLAAVVLAAVVLAVLFVAVPRAGTAFLVDGVAFALTVTAGVLTTSLAAPFMDGAVLGADSFFFADVAFFTAILGPFKVALGRPYKRGQVA